MRFLIVLSAVAVLGVLVLRFTNSVKREVAIGTARYAQRRAAEAATREEAPWFGKTGLADDEERELPHYLRREFGEFMDDETGLKARDLDYLGVQTDSVGPAHFWRIQRASADGPTFAYIDIDSAGRLVSYGWGNRTPPRDTSGAVPPP